VGPIPAGRVRFAPSVDRIAPKCWWMGRGAGILACMMKLIFVATFGLVVAGAAQQAQQPWKGKNLKFFPADIKREVLVQRMREFSFALNVRCQYCHAGGDGISFEGVDFSSDDKPAKNKARAMLRLTDQVNKTLLPEVPSRADPAVSVDCVTCHHGLALPKSLQTTLFEVVNKDGAPAAAARYRELRTSDTLTGKYSFDEWEINELARRLAVAGKTAEAIAMLEMNGEFYPKSGAIDFQIGELQLARGEKDKALARYKTAQQKSPDDPRVKARIEQLEKK
jgi:Photosynthetic reaction centre cytochrome C subunit/Tetratricopeptide repeat